MKILLTFVLGLAVGALLLKVWAAQGKVMDAWR